MSVTDQEIIRANSPKSNLENYQKAVLSERIPLDGQPGIWRGELSSSALSTATAVTALIKVRQLSAKDDQDQPLMPLIEGGINWLIANQNEDGGFGDTAESPSNISTSSLVWGVFHLYEQVSFVAKQDKQRLIEPEQRLSGWLAKFLGETKTPSQSKLMKAIVASYGKDKTFSVPILTMLCLCGRLQEEERPAWHKVMQLPFEMAAFPQSLYRKLNLRVVSYALPALIAIGQVRHHLKPSWFVPARLIRDATVGRTLKLLRYIQPDSGGYLEATPLTSFVLMSLAEIKGHRHLEDENLDSVMKEARRFLINSARLGKPETEAELIQYAWAIDTDLATWGTTLSVQALAEGGEQPFTSDEAISITTWLLDQQYTERHPYTGADPGGWAWTDEPGGVPDSDDTSGALIALSRLRDVIEDDALTERLDAACNAGQKWLDGLQNKDGGIPTFCRGWGKLPFDRSCSDITAHRLRALLLSRDFSLENDGDLANVRRLTEYLFKTQYRGKYQDLCGSWAPLWFGSQSIQLTDFPKLDVYEANRTYGTSRVLLGLSELLHLKAQLPDDLKTQLEEAAQAGINWFKTSQQPCGGFGGTMIRERKLPVTIEETGLALEAMGSYQRYLNNMEIEDLPLNQAIEKARLRLNELTQNGNDFKPAPIGLYFARLWYHERLYPRIFSLAAMRMSQNTSHN